MTFISLEFVAFFAIVATIYFVLPLRMRWMWLLASSYAFYAFAGPIYALQLAALTAIIYFIGLRIDTEPDKLKKRNWVVAAIAVLVGNLVVFKYASFLNETVRGMFGLVGAAYSVPAIDLLVPIGISFYTFLLISYVVDVYKGLKAEQHPGIFALHVAFFPKLIAGPIERAKNLLPQLHVDHAFDYARVVAGLQLAAWGVFKKAVVADRIAPFVDRVYDNPHAFDGVSMAFATWLYAFQIYCDFSGYTDIALGVALILGFKLMANFNRPYFATSIQDFWKRWHISLTSWLTDYVYTPISRTKLIKMKWYDLMMLSLFITFVISGFWHGAQWTFVAWGALHGLYIVVALAFQKPFNKLMVDIGLTKRPQLYRSLKIVFTFMLVCLAYVLFRAATLEDAAYIFTHLPTGWGNVGAGLSAVILDNTGELTLALLGIAVVMGADFLQGKGDVGAMIATRPVWQRWSLYYAGAVSIVLLGAYYNVDQAFIYFRF